MLSVVNMKSAIYAEPLLSCAFCDVINFFIPINHLVYPFFLPVFQQAKTILL